MNYEYYNQFINNKTRNRCDITPIFENPEIFSNLLDDLIKPFKKSKIDKIAGLDAIGFIIGGALAQKLNVGFICIRKEGKLPGMKNTILKSPSFFDYMKIPKKLEINKSSVNRGDKILLVDEWIETGAQMKNSIKLIEKLNGTIIGISCLCIQKNKQTLSLFEKYDIKAIRIIDEL